MRFSLSSTALSSRLAILAKVFNSKNTIAILSDYVFDIHEGTLTLTASDNENTVRVSLPLNESDGEGRFAIGGDVLGAIKEISEQPITIDVSMDRMIADISYLNGHVSMPIESADEYPEAKKVEENAITVTLPANLLVENIGRSVFATASEELRPVMNGLYFDLTPDSLNVVASDGHKLVRNKILTVKSETPSSFILPKKPATLLMALLAKEGGDVTIAFDGRNADVKFTDGELSCRLIEGRYPNYNAVIPQNNNLQVTIDRQGLISALRRVAPFSSVASNLIRFHFEMGLLQIDAEDYDFSKTATERISCDYAGSPMNIGFKGTSFIEVLSNIAAPEIQILLSDPSRAGLVLPAVQPENQDVTMLLMPMLIND